MKHLNFENIFKISQTFFDRNEDCLINTLNKIYEQILVEK